MVGVAYFNDHIMTEVLKDVKGVACIVLMHISKHVISLFINGRIANVHIMAEALKVVEIAACIVLIHVSEHVISLFINLKIIHKYVGKNKLPSSS